MTTVSKEHISKTPGICGGKACIAGHRIRVMDVVVMYERWGFSPDQIADQYPGLTLADVHAALAYYFDHPAEIAAEFAREAAVAEQYGKTQRSIVKEKLAADPGLRERILGQSS